MILTKEYNLTKELGLKINKQMKDSSVLALVVAVYTALAVIFYVVTTVKIGRPFLIPLMIVDRRLTCLTDSERILF